MNNHLESMLGYHSWANRTILERISELPESILAEEVNSSYPTIAHALSHIHAVDQMWLLVLQESAMPEAMQNCMPLNSRVLDSVDEYADLFAGLSGEYEEWFRSQHDLEQPLLLDNPYAGVREIRRSDILMHVVNHGTYHRGNISTMLRQLGHASVMTDYAMFWYQEPVTAV
ncbi:DinB family protein [Saccharibacillus kuerlensis]|uniref:Diguanylate cyclase n=1 Tax=Saccharibacillus kuerlensis TaxID=459527 RepID=A0ABQ2LAF2_9BACL|nr:DinB family protein [Saccharibacillus kuerlensis]GGO08349.1 diguanylate cyclase [Saccharibacillus kuerlensis]